MKAKVVSSISIHRKVYLVLLLLSLSVTCSRHHAIVPFWCMLKYEITCKIISFKLMGHAYLHKKVTWHLYFSLKKILHNFASTKKDHTLSHKNDNICMDSINFPTVTISSINLPMLYSDWSPYHEVQKRVCKTYMLIKKTKYCYILLRFYGIDMKR